MTSPGSRTPSCGPARSARPRPGAGCVRCAAGCWNTTSAGGPTASWPPWIGRPRAGTSASPEPLSLVLLGEAAGELGAQFGRAAGVVGLLSVGSLALDV